MDLPVGTRRGHLLRKSQHAVGLRHRVIPAMQHEDLGADLPLRPEARRREQPVHADRTLDVVRARPRDIERAQPAEAIADDRDAARIDIRPCLGGGDGSQQPLAQLRTVIQVRAHIGAVVLAMRPAHALAIDVDCKAHIALGREVFGLRLLLLEEPRPLVGDQDAGLAPRLAVARHIALAGGRAVLVLESAFVHGACLRVDAPLLYQRAIALTRGRGPAKSAAKPWVPRGMAMDTHMTADTRTPFARSLAAGIRITGAIG